MERINEDIKQNSFAGVYLLYGEEEFLKEACLSRLLKALSCEEGSMNFSVFKGKGIREGDVIDSLETLPFFADRRVVLVSDSGFLSQKCDALADYVKKLPDYAVLIFSEKETDKRGRLYKACSKYERAVEFKKLDEKGIQDFVLSRLKREKKKIRRSAMELMLFMLGDDLANINSELDKLLSYTAEREEVTSEDIRSVCVGTITGRIFEMTAAAAAKDRKKALYEYRNLLALKEPPMRILYMLGRQFLQMKNVKELYGKGMGQQQIANALGLHPYAVKKTIPLCGKYTKEALDTAVNDFASVECDVKNGLISDRLAVEMMLIRYSG